MPGNEYAPIDHLPQLLLLLKGQRKMFLQQGHRVTSTDRPKYISHLAQYFRLLPSPISSPTFPCAIANIKHRLLQ